MEHLAVALDDLELGVVQGPATPEPLQPPGYDDLLALSQPPLDEPPPEPGGLDLTGLVAEARDRPLDAPSPRRLDVDVLDAGTGRYDRPLFHPDEVAQLRQLAQIVIPPRQVEEQVTDVVPPQSYPGAPQEACGAVSPDFASGVDRSSTGSVGAGGVGVRAGVRVVGIGAYSAEIRYR